MEFYEDDQQMLEETVGERGGNFDSVKADEAVENGDLSAISALVKNDSGKRGGGSSITKRTGGSRRTVLTAEKLLSGDRGTPELLNLFSDFRTGKDPVKDLNSMMAKLEQWAHRLCPSMPFDAVLEKIEELGCKRTMKTALIKMRMGESAAAEEDEGETENRKEDEEEKRGEENADATLRIFDDENEQFGNDIVVEEMNNHQVTTAAAAFTDEQRKRMEENRRKAEELRATKLTTTQQQAGQSQSQDFEKGEGARSRDMDFDHMLDCEFDDDYP